MPRDGGLRNIADQLGFTTIPWGDLANVGKEIKRFRADFGNLLPSGLKLIFRGTTARLWIIQAGKNEVAEINEEGKVHLLEENWRELITKAVKKYNSLRRPNDSRLTQ